MTLIDHTARIGRLGLVLQLRDAAIEPIVRVLASLPRSEKWRVGASAHSSRLEIATPFHPGAFALAGADTEPPADADTLLLRVDGAEVDIGASKQGPAPELEFANVAAWHAIVHQLISICGGRVIERGFWARSQTKHATVYYPARGPKEDLVLMLGLVQLAEDIGVSAAQRRLWQRIHPELGRGGEALSVTTGAVADRLSNQLIVRYASTGWDQVVRFGQGLVLNDSEAKRVSTDLGKLAGALGTEPEAIELRLGPHEPPDVVVWAPVAAAD